MDGIRTAARARNLLAGLVLLAAGPAGAQGLRPSFVSFESGPVRPLALSPAGTRLFALNVPDGRLSILDVTSEGISLAGEVQVGLEPVAVAARSDDEVWVVNHLSDSISVVDVPSLRVVRTLLVGDEPRDLVFAGPGRSRAFVTTAHRGQHRTHPSIASVPGAGDPLLTTPGVGRADVWVFDAEDPGGGPGGTPLAIVTLFGDTPRALAATPDGATVYAAVFHSGNGTTTVSAGAVCVGFDRAGPCTVDGAQMPGGSPGPSTNHAGDPAPHVGLIVRHDPGTGAWLDELGRDWSAAVRFDLPDLDVFAIDAATLAPTAAIPRVGTTLFNMVVNPADGTLYVSNQEARNEVRFEGPGEFAGSSVRGNLAAARITVIPSGGEPQPLHLNRHVPPGPATAPPGTADHSLAIPLDMAVSSDGSTLYVAAFGSSRVGVYRTSELEGGSLDPTVASREHLEVRGGPSGLSLDEARGRLYVLGRFENVVSAIDLSSGDEIAAVALFDPEPEEVRLGRPFLYDARTLSANGEASCASCHVFGDLDHLAWDLGNPDDEVTRSPMEIQLGDAAGLVSPPINGTGRAEDFHPMKGPMTTQTLRGMLHSGAQHWRGDRATGFYGESADDARLSFKNFVVAFDGLLGRDEPLTEAEMESFADFALALVLPPNPVRPLDGSLPEDAQRGRDFYFGPRLSDGVPGFGFTCDGCHTLDPARGLFGTSTKQSFENETQIMKVAHLRNAYQKVGMFGMIPIGFFGRQEGPHQGDQIRGFGFLHDGSTDTLFRFLHATVFDDSGVAGFDGGDAQRRDMEAFLLAYDSDLAPVVGQQVTLHAGNAADAGPRIDLLLQRAAAPFTSRILGGQVTECDLVAKVRIGDRVRGYVLQDGLFEPDDGSPALSDAELRRLASVPGQEVTYTAVPPGSGVRVGIDRDLDGWLDGGVRAGSHGGGDDGPGTGEACGCRGSPGGAALLGLVVLALLRRRSR